MSEQHFCMSSLANPISFCGSEHRGNADKPGSERLQYQQCGHSETQLYKEKHSTIDLVPLLSQCRT